MKVRYLPVLWVRYNVWGYLMVRTVKRGKVIELTRWSLHDPMSKWVRNL